MERCNGITIIFLLVMALAAAQAGAKPANVLLQDGIYAEQTKGDLDGAMKIYEQIIEDTSAERPYIAEAMYRLGMCYVKKQNEVKARALFERLVSQFSDQSEVVSKVRPMLDEMTEPDPAALMPADTKIYLEIGEPGRQVETLLKMLQGTPFSNPLAMIGAGQKGGGKSPGDIIGALLNPSMMAEFKKIKALAVGIMDVRQNNPPMVAVLYPGKSDALRGIIIAALGVVGRPGEAIEGMQTVEIKKGPGVAYDDTVVIMAMPKELLGETIKRYKGADSLPSLASDNKMFSKLSRKFRQRNAFTQWIDVGGTYRAIAKLAGNSPQLDLVNGIVDFNGIEDIVVYNVLEQTAVTDETIINFRASQQSLAYGMLRTPPLERSGFASVPAEAVAVGSIALGESSDGQAQAVQRKIKHLTGLDIGREVFANIEQISVFALPPRSKVGQYGLSDALSCFGVSLTSRYPVRTRLLLGKLLGIAELAAGAEAKTSQGEQPKTGQEKYFLGELEGRKLYCYLAQSGNTTVLSLNGPVVSASVSALTKGRSALTDGPLHNYLGRTEAQTNKLLAVNVGGAIRIADEFIKAANKNPHNPGHKLMGQLARACGKATVMSYTVETDTSLRIHSSINDIPALGGIFPIVMQLSQYDLGAKARATRPNPPDGADLRVGAKIKLDWDSGVASVSHKVWFGTDAEKLAFIGDVNDPNEVKLPELKDDVKYYWRVDEVMKDGSVIKGDVWSFAMTGKLLGLWKFDESSGLRAGDSSGNGNDGVLHGNAMWTENGKIGGAIELDGDGDYVEVTNESNFDITKQMTAAVWVKINKFDKPFESIVSKGTNKGWLISRSHSKPTVEFVCNGLRPLPYVVGKTPIDDGKWHHLAGVYDGSKLRLYIDGKLDASRKARGSIVTNDYNVYIGDSSQQPGRYFNGLIDDVRIYNYALTADEVAKLAQGE